MKRDPEAAPVRKDISAPVQFSQPVVAPGVTDPSALRYARGLQERHGTGRYATPVAGGPTPSIPRLDAAAAVGVSMADQAAMHRAVAEGPAPGPIAPSSGIFQGPPPPTGRIAPPPAKGPAPIPVLPGDILPDEAMQDPEYRTGQGARYASSQPQLALKYGVIRNGKRIPPQQLATAPKGLKPETLEGLKAIQAAQAAREQVESPEARVEQEAAGGAAGAAGRLGNSPSDGPQTRPALSEKDAVEALKKMDDFDFSTFREMMMKDIINNDDQRKIIEKRCKPMDLTDIVTAGFVTQRVPIVPDKFEPEFQSMRSDEDLAIKRLIMLENKGLEVTERYLLDKFSVMGVTIGLRSINGTLLPTHLDNDGRFNEALFLKKFDFVARLPFHLGASIGVNYYWFDIRVRRLFVADTLGNG